MKAILLCDTAGRKYDGAVKSAVKRLMPGATPHSQTNVLTGELLVEYYQEGQPFNYQVYNDPNVLLFTDGDSISPLGKEEFLLLEAIGRPGDRIEAFRYQLDFGMTLREGSSATVTLPGANLSVPTRVRAVVHYKGKVGNQPGTLFGVEILDKTQRREKPGVSDGTFQGYRYFQCDDGYGLFVSLRWLSPADGDTTGTSLDRRDRQRGGELRPSYSQVTGGGPSQNTRSSGRPLYSKAASTDGSPSATRRSEGNRPYMKSASRDDAVSSSKAAKAAPSKEKGPESSVDPVRSQFKKGQRVMFYDNKGEKHYGTVGWSGKNTRTRTFDYTLVGIQTDEPVYKSDYENSLPGMDHLMSAPKMHALYLPETLVEEVPKPGGSESSPRPARSDTAQEIADALDLNISQTSLVKQQVELFKEAEQEAAVEAMKAAEQSIDLKKQQEYYEKLQAENAAKGQIITDQNEMKNADVTQQQVELQRYKAQMRAQDRNNARDSLGDRMDDGKYTDTGRRFSNHIYEPVPHHEGHEEAGAPPPQGSPSSHHRQIHQHHGDARPAQEQMMPGDQGMRQPPHQADCNQPGHGAHQETSFSQHPSAHGYPPHSAGAEHNLGYQQDGNEHLRRQPPPPPHTRQDIPGSPRVGPDPRGGQSITYHPGENHDSSRSQSAQGPPPGAQGPSASGPPSGQGVFTPAGFAASTGPPGEENLSHGLGVGSLIQLPAMDGSVKYGTIKWTGLISTVQGEIAGIELEEPMEGCNDGTFPATGQKFFNCPHGMGLYYPLNKLRPDHRWAPQVAVDGNPLRHVRSEEMLDTPAPDTLEMYIGNERGIQGHQNSCYLDATLFGLFAICDEFDAMFLKKESDIGKTLWRNIVNPLRKNGVVKYECVMQLREQLDKLGQMKGITQDEKDPEEFLNLMFKHTLHVPPFISIRRPFGVEKEYFVQLFSEMDGSKEPPSISNLLEKMFLEQHISFTEVPSKLLIQVPRFGKKFQTFQKIIPAKTINVASIVDVQGKCFFCDEENARHYCPDCKQEFSDPTYCDHCLERAHKKRTDHKQVGLTKEAVHLQTLADLELLSVICIETSHYVCFTRQEDRWIFFDSMANRVYDKYNIPKVDECTRDLNNWVYPPDGNLSRLLNTPPRELPEYVRRFTQDIYMCVYIQPGMSMYS